MMEQHKKYANKIPKEVRLAIDGMSGQNEVGYAVMMLLIDEGDLRFGEIEEKLDLHSQKVSNAVSKLQKGGLITKKAGERIGSKSTGAYTITDFGNRIFEALYQASQPEIRVPPESTIAQEIQRESQGAILQESDPKEVAPELASETVLNDLSNGTNETTSNISGITGKGIGCLPKAATELAQARNSSTSAQADTKFNEMPQSRRA